MNLKVIFFCLLFVCNQAFCLVDLEVGIQDFVLGTKKLEVPGYPYAFNPSIIRWNGDLLMTFRIIPDRKQSFNSEIGVVWLDEEYRAISVPQILDLTPPNALQHVPSRAEDARLVSAGGSLYIVYDDNRDEKITRGGFRVYIAKLDVVGRLIIPKEVEAITRFEGESQNVREKGWVPFEYSDELLLAYSLSPHRIFRHLPSAAECETFAESDPEIEWDWGVLRGGTPGIKIDGRYYLAFFHSSKKMKTIHSNDQEVLHYFMGAYTFSLEPPFEIAQMSSEPIVGPNFYRGEIYKPYWHPVRAVFPGGFLCDGNTISVFYGRQDHEMWVVKFDKNKLLKSLVPIETKTHPRATESERSSRH